MIDFSRTELTHFAVHHVGNKGLGENLVLSDKLLSWPDDFVKETTLRYFLTPFKNDIYYYFKRSEFRLNATVDICEDIFKDRKQFLEKSTELAENLYDQTMHPKIPGGGFYVCYFKDVVCDGELVDAIGMFKTETHATYLKLNQNSNKFDLECDSGIDIKKLDKGCLIFNTEKEHGYKISIINNNKSSAECAFYWQTDFLNAWIKQNNYFHTTNMIDVSRAFVAEKLVEEGAMDQLERLSLLNKSVNHFAEIVNFNQKTFEKEILKEKDLIKLFNEFKEKYNEIYDYPAPPEEFEVSATAVKENKKHMRSIIKLDKNFHLHIHSMPEYLEKGFDEEKGLKYYKMYYVNEE